MDIKELLGQKYLERFQVYNRETLFEPFWGALLERRCPLCGNKLKKPLRREIMYCYGKKHGKSPFFIDMKRLNSIELAYGNALPTG